MRYLSAAETLLLHELLLGAFGGMRGITEQGFGRLDTAVGSPQQSMFGVDLYASLPEKGAVLLRGLIRGHPFSDGNKRVAILALCEFLTRNGADLAASNDEVYELAMAAANGLEREAISIWIERHLA